MMNKKQIYFEDEKLLNESKFFIEKPENILSEFGLSQNQSRVYLYLVKFGSTTAPNLSKSLNIPRTEIYAILKILQKKRCIETKNEKPLKFSSIPFEDFLETVINLKKNEIQKLEETLEIIKTLKSSKKNFSKFQS